LYCEEVDVGDGSNHQVVVGVCLFVPIEQMENRGCLCFVNIKPSKVRGEPLELMLFAASNDDHTAVEMLGPPEATAIGTRVTCSDIQLVEKSSVDAKEKVEKAATENDSLRINENHFVCCNCDSRLTLARLPQQFDLMLTIANFLLVSGCWFAIAAF
jgi:tRNA-binding EMAP/Myf-like protein